MESSVASTPSQTRGLRKTRVGVVVSNKMDKTIVVAVERRVKHPLYQKYVKRTRKFMAHDEQNQCDIGDRVRIMDRATEVARAVTIPSNREVLHVLPRGFIVDGQEGVKDPLGMSAAGVAAAVALTRLLYERYFRVTSQGAWRIPRSGPAILAANHSGLLPFDAMMLYADVVRRTDPPRDSSPG